MCSYRAPGVRVLPFPLPPLAPRSALRLLVLAPALVRETGCGSGGQWRCRRGSKKKHTYTHRHTHRHTQTHTQTHRHTGTHTHTNTSGLTTHGQNIYERVQLKFVLAEKAPDHSPGLQTIAKNFANRAKPRGEKSSQKRPKLRHTRMPPFGWGA